MLSLRYLLGLVLAGSLSIAPAAGQDSKSLKYGFTSGQTYIYHLSIVAEIGAGSETSKGTAQVAVKSVSDGRMELTPSVSLATTTKAPPTTSSGKKGSKSPPTNPFNRVGAAAARELTIDVFGNVLNVSGQAPLPVLLGHADDLIVEPLSATGESRWQRTRDMVLKEGGVRSTPKKGAPRTVGGTETVAKETATYQITGRSGTTATIKKTYEFKTVAAAGAPSRLQFQYTGNLTFDPKAGVIKSGDYKGAIVVNENNVTFRIPVTASLRMFTEAESVALKKQEDENRAKAKAAFEAARVPKEVPEAEVLKAVTDMKSKDRGTSLKGFGVLARALPIPSQREHVASEIVSTMNEFKNHHAAADALMLWGTDKAVAPLLKHPNGFVRVDACKILGQVGTAESLPALRSAESDTSPFLRAEATKAIKAIESRK